MILTFPPTPFALSPSKGLPSYGEGEGKGFDKLSPNGGWAGGGAC